MNAFSSLLVVFLYHGVCSTSSLCTTSGPVLIPKQDSKVIHVLSAEMWKCLDGDDSLMQCSTSATDYPFGCQGDALWIPNVFSLVRFWCQNKKSCKFDPFLILSQKYEKNISNSSYSSKSNYLFQWEIEMVESTALTCPYSQSIMIEDSCFMLTPTKLNWQDTQLFCRRHGGDLANFYLKDIRSNSKRPWLRYDPLYLQGSLNVSVWFKMFSNEKEQRTPQNLNTFKEDFSCEIFDINQREYRAANCGTTANISVNKIVHQVGRCVLPPLLPGDFTCPGECFPDYQNFCWGDTKIGTKVYKNCPIGLKGTASWTCGADGRWLSPVPDLSNCTTMAVAQFSENLNTLQTSTANNGELTLNMSNVKYLPDKQQPYPNKHIHKGTKPGKKVPRCEAKCVSEYENFCWEEIEANTKAHKNCPLGFDGTASWSCGANGRWLTNSPDLRNCRDTVVDDFINKAKEKMKNGEDPSALLKSITHALHKKELLFISIEKVEQTVRLAISKQKERLTSNTDPNSRDANSRNFTSYVVDLTDVILANDKAFWGLQPNMRREAIDRVQKNIDDTLHLLRKNLVNTKFRKALDNLIVQVEKYPKEEYKAKTFIFHGPNQDTVILPVGFPDAASDQGETSLSFAVFPSLKNLLHGDTLAKWEESMRNGSTSDPLKHVVVSNVCGVSLGHSNEQIRFKNGKVEMFLGNILNLTHYDVERSSARCVFWDILSQDWSSEGCEMIPNKDPEIVQCQCDHLTNFAVLMDINGIFLDKKILALEYITIIGESISIVCLTLTLIIFFWVRKLRNEFRIQIHRNLCLNMLIAEIILLAGLDATSNSGLCLAIAIFLHFFWLCAFGWMLVEGLFMYFGVTKVFNGNLLKRWQYYFIGYGFPVLIVAITLISTSTSAYRNSSYCWLSYANGVIWAFAGPVAAVIMMNTVFLVVALSVACKSKRNRKLGKEQSSKNLRWIFGVSSLTFILGITWLSGFFMLSEFSITFAYIFTTLNSLQGLVIFFTFCVLNNQVTNELKRQMAAYPAFIFEKTRKLNNCLLEAVAEQRVSFWLTPFLRRFRRVFRRLNVEFSDTSTTRSGTRSGSRKGNSENQGSETTALSFSRKRNSVKSHLSVGIPKRGLEKRESDVNVFQQEEKVEQIKQKEEEKENQQKANVEQVKKEEEDDDHQEKQFFLQPDEENKVQIHEKEKHEETHLQEIYRQKLHGEDNFEKETHKHTNNIDEKECVLATIRQTTIEMINDGFHSEMISECQEQRKTVSMKVTQESYRYSTNLRPTQTTSLRHLVIFTDQNLK